MKKTLTLIAAILFIAIFTSNATVRTVTNHPLDGSQYSSLQAAYNAAVNSDTLLIEGSSITYNITSGCAGVWSKSLVVIGAGHNTQKQQFQRTIISASSCVGSFRLHSGSNGSKFFGIYFNNGVDFDGANSNIVFDDCLFGGPIMTNNNTLTGIQIRNCIFDQDNAVSINLPSSATSTVTINNCIFDGWIQGNGNNFNTVLIDHSLFLGYNIGTVVDGMRSSSITNCIFMNQTSVSSNTTGCTFLNNISRLSTLPPAGNTGSGNQDNTNPNFVTYTLNAFYSNTHDYHLQAGSPAIAVGSDATDIGPHGGTSKFSEQGEPLNAPVMRSMQINNTTVAPNGTLNVDINASKPDDN